MKIHHLSDIHYRKTKKKQIMILKIKVLLTLKNMNLIKNKFTKKMNLKYVKNYKLNQILI